MICPIEFTFCMKKIFLAKGYFLNGLSIYYYTKYKKFTFNKMKTLIHFTRIFLTFAIDFFLNFLLLSSTQPIDHGVVRQCSSKCIARMWLFSLHHTDHAFANSAEISHMCVSRAPKRRSGGQSLREGFFVCVLGGAEGTTYTVVASLALVQHQGSHNFSDLFRKKFRVTYVFWNFETYKE